MFKNNTWFVLLAGLALIVLVFGFYLYSQESGSVIEIDSQESESVAEIDLDLKQSDELIVHYFRTDTCPFCARLDSFLNEVVLERYPELEIRRYNMTDRAVYPTLRYLSEKHGAERYMGSVPLTFIGDRFFTGFDNAEGIGAEMLIQIERLLAELEEDEVE